MIIFETEVTEVDAGEYQQCLFCHDNSNLILIRQKATYAQQFIVCIGCIGSMYNNLKEIANRKFIK